jgi:hypothetical protein
MPLAVSSLFALADPASVSAQLSDYDRIATGLKAVTDISVSLNGWALLILGGTLAVMLSNSYRKPPFPYRLIFLIVFPSLGCLIYALERGSHVQATYAALLLRPRTDAVAHQQFSEANTALAAQVQWFEIAVVLLAIWLALYLIWWIFLDRQPHVEM